MLLRTNLIRCAMISVLVMSACTASEEPASTSAPGPTTTDSADTSTTSEAGTPAYRRADLPAPDRVEDLLGRMTLAEKIGQMTLVEKNSIAVADLAELGIGGLLSGGGGSPTENTPEAWAEMVRGFQEEALQSRLGIPLIYGVDAVHGHSNVVGAVVFPHNIGLGAADDPDLMERIGHVTAVEVAATGIHWNYAPAVSVPRDIRWGRTYEGYSEDPAIVTRLATAYLEGLQGDGLDDPDTVLATPKHFVGDGGTTWGSSTTGGYEIDQGVTGVDENELRDIHLAPYPAVIEAGAASIMASYSSWGGLKMHAHEYLLTDVLKGELGFPGFIVSDWEAIDQISDDYYDAVVTAINAGVDMNMVPRDYLTFIATLSDAVAAGDVAEGRIDDAVRRILRVKFELGLFERPYGDDTLLERVGSDEHRAVAREAVARSMVLLENDDDLLPLDPDLPLLVVAGSHADDIGLQSGGWTIEWQGGRGPITPGTTILDGIRATVSSDTDVVFDRNGSREVPDGADAVVCVVAVGEQPYAEGLGDEAAPRLPASDEQLLNRMRAQCDELVVVLVTGRPLLIDDLVDGWDALVAAWLPGTEGQGVADVLFGLEPFTGTLPYTWPADVDQLPQTTIDGEPLYPRGFALVVEE